MNQVVDSLFALAVREVAARRHLPESTYRLQLHAGFTFRDALRIVPYLHELGITHCYASPYLKARPGSQHGYDIIDHRVLNPEIGTEEDYNAWVEALHAHGLGQVLDTVPNHMGIVGNENPWWNDVLENGADSPYSTFFDISWYSSPRPELHGKVLLPMLGEPYGKVLESQQVRLEYDHGAFAVRYFEHRWPVAPPSYRLVLGHRLEELRQRLDAGSPELSEYESILTAVKHLPLMAPTRFSERQREQEVVKRRLAALTQESAAVRAFVDENVTLFNGTAGDPRSFDLLDQLLNDQHYRLCYWRVASDEINYRRFFDINELAALSMEREEVFEATHQLILRLLGEGKISGLRIDHPDGLYDPRQYLFRLQEHHLLGQARDLFEARPEFRDRDWAEVEGPLRERIRQGLRQWPAGEPWPLYVVVEKILAFNEPLRPDWPTYGTSGYEFLNWLNGIFVASDNTESFTRVYQEWVQDRTPLPEVVYRSKELILRTALSSELFTLAHQLDRLAQKDRWSRDFTLHSLRQALREVTACFPVYRSYISAEGVSDLDRQHVRQAVKRARARNATLSPSYFDFISDMLLQKYRETAGAEDRAEELRFAGKFQQVTAPVMAKGLEDTAFYVYNRLLSLNEVGGDPGRFGLPRADLHEFFGRRQQHGPWALSTTSTHDTKRSEDVRARLNVLSEMPGQWHECLARWGELNKEHHVLVDEEAAPDANEEYFLYQTLVGSWPLEPYTEEEYAAFVRRVQDCLRKALQEAKVHTSWINPDPDYDAAVRQFIGRILDPAANATFVDEFRAFHRKVSHFGLLNSLAQTLVKLTAPGVPDVYQGTEVWDFSLVDPDNRRPVDYEHRGRLLRQLHERTAGQTDLRAFAGELLAAKEDGRIKLFLTERALRCRRDRPGLFTSGDYLPVEIAGMRRDNVFAFARRVGDVWAVVVISRLLARTGLSAPDLPLGPEFWQDTHLVSPGIPPGVRLRNVLTGADHVLDPKEQGTLLLGDLLAHLPVALLVGQP
jgi:(1->4)-alpha-D-glucan 1-alpha-D-glucosylmutase